MVTPPEPAADAGRPRLVLLDAIGPDRVHSLVCIMHHHNNLLGQPIGFPLHDWKPPELPSGEPMEGRFCRIEQLNPSVHAASLHTANAMDVDGRMWTYLPYGPFETLASYRAWAEEMCTRRDPCHGEFSHSEKY